MIIKRFVCRSKTIKSIESLYRPLHLVDKNGRSDVNCAIEITNNESSFTDVLDDSETIQNGGRKSSRKIYGVGEMGRVDHLNKHINQPKSPDTSPVPIEDERLSRLLKSIYRSSSNGIYDDRLWKRYIQQLNIVVNLLKVEDLCSVLYSLGKIRYKDNKLISSINAILTRKIDAISCEGISLILNALKRLNVHDYNFINILTNQFCSNIHRANLQDVSLVANSLSYFHIYHLKFWNSLYNVLMLRHYKITSLQASLILLSLSKLDIRNAMILKIMKKKLANDIKIDALPPVLLSLIYYSFAKLNYKIGNFFEICNDSFINLLKKDDRIDVQSQVLFLFANVCLMDANFNVIKIIFESLSKRDQAYLKDYKVTKLKYIIEHLSIKHPQLFEELYKSCFKLIDFIKEYKVKKIRKLSRWANEVSLILRKNNIKHQKNQLLDYIYADILVHKSIIKCAGPYSYYVKSTNLTKFCELELNTLKMRGYDVYVIGYYEWNKTKEEDKLNFIKNLLLS